jgi:hypothetical protein
MDGAIVGVAAAMDFMADPVEAMVEATTNI